MLGRLSVEVRFWNKVLKTDSCWLWTGSVNNHGYGKINVCKKYVLVHRLSYEIHCRIVLSKSICVLHHCDTPACVNPKHLFLGDKQANVDDMISKGRHSCGETRWNSKLTEKDVFKLRKLWGTGYWTQCKLAELFNISTANVSLIVSGQRWKHLL